EAERHALHLVLVELPPRAVLLARVEVDAEAGRGEVALDAAGGLEHGLPLLVLAVDRDEGDLRRGELRREHEAAVVAVRHDEGADEAGRDAPARGPDVLLLVVLILEDAVE